MTRILVVEDEPDIQSILDYNLQQAGYEVRLTESGHEAVRLAADERPDLVLLDLMLPDLSGTDVCKAIKSEAETKDIPIVILTAKGDEIDRIVGFELGAVDYVVKPFSIRELVLRIRAILRHHNAPETPREDTEARFTFGELTVDRAAHRVWVKEREVTLTHLEWKLLLTLYDRRDRVQSRTVLLDDVWGIDSNITSRTVDTHIQRLRDKLAGASQYIQTVRGVGYRFISDPEEAVA